MVTTDDDAVADQVRLLRHHGQRGRYEYEQFGFNLRMTDVHAAIGLVQVGRLGELTSRRRANAEQLTAGITSVVTPAVRPGADHVWHQYTVRVPDIVGRDRLRDELEAAGIGTGIFYPTPVHRLPFIRKVTGDFALPATDAAAREVLSLPVHPLLTPDDVSTIVREVNRL